MSLFTVTLILFLVMDPIGNLPSYEKVMRQVSHERHRLVLFREMFIALIAGLTFNFLGEVFFEGLELREESVTLASGLVMFLISLSMLFPKPDTSKPMEGEPFIFPLAIPMLAGPAYLATVMLFAHSEPLISTMCTAIVIAWVFSVIILSFAKPIKNALTDSGVIALERLSGMILLLLSVQRFMDGLKLFFSEI